MKRAYPQYLAAGGEELPPAVLEVIFPLDYWPLIEKYSRANDLDPYLMAALIAQESTFTADVRSPANAYGLMQLLPATGRRYAPQGCGISAVLDAHADAAGDQHPHRDRRTSRISSIASAARTTRWPATTPARAASRNGCPSDRASPQDEFIDDIPFPETQNYVKRILGTAEDYRRLYGGGLLAPGSLKNAPPARELRAKPKASPARKPPVRKASLKKSKKTR